jgi:prepilin-type N-terminal cleavage/methylation domain-containing protein
MDFPFSHIVFAKKQSGFTLVEMTISLAITGVLGVGILTGLFQLRSVNDIDNARMSAVKQVENAIYYINRDVQSSQTITPEGATGFPLTLSWRKWNPPDEIEIVYELNQRPGTDYYDLYRNNQVVAEYISSDSDETSCSYSQNTHKLSITLTSIYPAGSKTAHETREVEIIPRPGS